MIMLTLTVLLIVGTQKPVIGKYWVIGSNFVLHHRVENTLECESGLRP